MIGDPLQLLASSVTVPDGSLVVLADVSSHLGEPSQLLFVVIQGCDHDAGPKARAVLADAPALRAKAASRPGRSQLRLGHTGSLVLRQVEHREMLADDLSGSVSLDVLSP